MKNVMRSKTVLLLTAVVLLLTVAVGGTVAYLSTSTNEVKNTFEPASVVPVIHEDFTDKTVKKNVRIENDGNVDAYIRVALIGNWCDAEGNVLQSVPVQVTATDWFVKGGYYYYSKPVSADGYTGYLIGSDGYAPANKPDGADHFQMEVLAQAIQATPDSVVTDTWGVVVNTAVDGTKTISAS